MEELLAAIAQATNVPAEMVERSAEARAKADGVAIEDVLRSWSGGGEITAAAPVAASPDPPAETPAAVEAAPAPVTPVAMDEASIVAAAAEKMGMPESMVRRSAAARAKAQGVEADAVLVEWAGVDTSMAVPAATSAPMPAAPEPAPASPGAAVDDAAIIAAAAEKMGIPESMVRRSAAARAKAQGVEADAVLMEWAGVDVAPAAPASAATSTPASTSAPASTAVEPTPAAAAPAESAPVAVVEPEVLGSSDEVASPSTSEPSDPFESKQEATAGGALPRWLAALFVLVPAFAIGYALFLPNGPNCGDAGSLAIDPVTGLAVNCDGSEFGAEFVDLFSLGSEIYDGAGCAACHGPNGGGIATFPAFTGGALLATFPQDSCSTQVEWIALGTTGWPESTYGANEKPVGGSGAVMPGFDSSLSSEEMAAVAIYERVAFGGQELEDALLDCGGESEAGAAALGE